MDSEKGAPKQDKIKRLVFYQGSSSFGNGIAAPFIPYYAARLNATAVQMGWLNALSTLLPNILQYPWAKFSDMVKRRLPFIIFGSTLIAASFLLLTAAVDATTVIIIVLIQAAGTAIVAPAWSALMGDVVPEDRRGKIFSKLNIAARAMSIIGIMGTGILVLFALPTSSQIFHVGFIIAAIAFVVAAMSLLFLREQRTISAESAHINGEVTERSNDFRYFLKAQVVFTFFMAIAWPLMPLTVVEVLHATNLEIVLLSVFGAVTAITFQFAVGRALDRVGPIIFITGSRFMLILIPLAYGFALNVYWLYGVNAFVGIVDAMISISMVAYLLDLAPIQKRAEYFARYSTLIGISSFFGAIVGGYLTGYLRAFVALPTALLIVYSISTVGRAVGAGLHLKLKDPRAYPKKVSFYEYVRYQITHFLHIKRH